MSSEEIVRAHEVRIGALENKMSDMQVTLTKLEGDIRLNNVMTEDIRQTLHKMRADSADGVSLIKGMSVLGRLMAWIVGFGVAVYAVTQAVNVYVESRAISATEVRK